MSAAFIKVSRKDHEISSSRTLLTIARCSSSDNVLQNARNFRRSFLGGQPRSTALFSSSDNCESHSSKISSLRSRSPLIFIASWKARSSTRLRSPQGKFRRAQKICGGSERSRDGVPQNYAEAIKWTLMAAKQGNFAAQASMALFYKRGQGVRLF